MSGASREKDAADYDLERFTEMFDQALTSDDPRVKNALRQLMMMVILTDTDDHEGRRRSHGPLRQMQQDMRDQFKWIRRLEQEIENLKKQIANPLGGYQTKDYGLKYGDTTSGQMVDPKEYWNSVIAQKTAIPPGNTMAEMSVKINSGLNTKVRKTNIGEE